MLWNFSQMYWDMHLFNLLEKSVNHCQSQTHEVNCTPTCSLVGRCTMPLSHQLNPMLLALSMEQTQSRVYESLFWHWCIFHAQHKWIRALLLECSAATAIRGTGTLKREFMEPWDIISSFGCLSLIQNYWYSSQVFIFLWGSDRSVL